MQRGERHRVLQAERAGVLKYIEEKGESNEVLVLKRVRVGLTRHIPRSVRSGPKPMKNHPIWLAKSTN